MLGVWIVRPYSGVFGFTRAVFTEVHDRTVSLVISSVSVEPNRCSGRCDDASQSAPMRSPLKRKRSALRLRAMLLDVILG